MDGLTPAIELSFEGETFPVFLGTDRRLYAPFTELCHVAGLDWRRYLTEIVAQPILAHHFIYLAKEGRKEEPFMNLGIMSFWLGTLNLRGIPRKQARERARRFQRQFQDTTWLLHREGFEISAPV